MQKGAHNTALVLIIILIVAVGFFIYQRFLRDDFNLPKNGKTTTETIMLRDGEVVSESSMTSEEKEEQKQKGVFETKEIVN